MRSMLNVSGKHKVNHECMLSPMPHKCLYISAILRMVSVGNIIHSLVL